MFMSLRCYDCILRMTSWWYDSYSLTNVPINFNVYARLQTNLCIGRSGKALELASTLKASKLVPMPNAEIDFSGPLGQVVTEGNTLDEFLQLASNEDVEVVLVKATEGVDIWP